MYNHSKQIPSSTLATLQSVLGNDLQSPDDVTPNQVRHLQQLAIAYSLPVTTSITQLISLWNNGEANTTTVTIDTTEAEQRLNDALHTRFHEYESGAKDRLSTSMSTINDRQVEWLKDMRNQLDVIKEKSNQGRHLVVKTDTSEVSFEGELVHEIFEDVLTTITCDNVYLVGGAGAGKTTLGYQVAKALKLDFYSTSAVKWEHQLMGNLTATGEYKPTDFYRAFKDGGVFLFDEMDASHPNALVSFNQALDVKEGMACPFPCGMIKKHKNFKAIASANTVGHGASRQYIGRNKLDGATLDRFAEIDMRYDENIERSISQHDEWVNEVRTVRAIAEEKKMAYIISPRASMKGAMLLKAGMSITKVRKMRLYKGMTEADASLLRKECKKRMQAQS